jgi:glycosyltransferase involved in cell wall biosynthesis
LDISVVIPAYNEENFIKNTIESIIKWMPPQFKYEIIVVNHGSADKTAEIAIATGARVLDGKSLKTVAALRNFGVANSTGNILFFIDADITFSEAWSANISDVVSSIYQDSNQICGSHPKIPESANVLIQKWFNPKELEVSPNHIGSCHLITSRSLFNKIGGFPEDMETSEDLTLCQRARDAGAKINANPALIVTHHGAPKTLANFIKTEIWHGRGDWTNLTSVLSSKVAILTLSFLFFHSLLIYSLAVKNDLYSVALAAIFLQCIASSYIKFFKFGASYFLFNILTFYFYFFGRSLSLISTIGAKRFSKRSRPA